VAEVGLDLEERPESARSGVGEDSGDPGLKAPFVAHTEHEAGRLAEIDRSDRFLAGESKRFLAEDVLARRDRLPDLLAVEGVRGCEDDRVDLPIVERRLQVRGDRNPELVADLLGGGGVRLHRANEFDFARLLFYEGAHLATPPAEPNQRNTDHSATSYLAQSARRVLTRAGTA
jgi:hypothetical protein